MALCYVMESHCCGCYLGERQVLESGYCVSLTSTYICWSSAACHKVYYLLWLFSETIMVCCQPSCLEFVLVTFTVQAWFGLARFACLFWTKQYRNEPSCRVYLCVPSIVASWDTTVVSDCETWTFTHFDAPFSTCLCSVQWRQLLASPCVIPQFLVSPLSLVQ